MNQERCDRQIGSSDALPAQVPLTNMFSYLQMSNEKNPCCLGCIGDYTTQIYGDFNKPI